MNDAPLPAGALDGVRVIEFAGLGPAPFAAMMLADHGAEIIRIERKAGSTRTAFVNSRFDVPSRGRRSVAIDLRAPAGRDLALDLIAQSDALIEGFRPGVMERLGLGPVLCLERNARLVYGRMTGWGREGPLAERAGHDLNYLGLTGALNAIGPREEPPPPPLNLAADYGGGGMLLAFGILAAMLHARRSGVGQVVDAAMIDGAGLLSGLFHGLLAGGYWSESREANLLDGAAYFYSTYRCADGKFLAVACIEPQFHDLLVARLDLDPAVFTHMADPAQWPALKKRLAILFATRPRDHWAALFEGTDACVTPILSWSEARSHPHAAARHAFVAVDGVPQPAPAPRFSRTPAPPPSSSEANFGAGAEADEALLRTFGAASARIEAARAVGAL